MSKADVRLSPNSRSDSLACAALWECLLASGADVSDYAYETQTEEGRQAGFEEFHRRGTPAEVVLAVQELRKDYDECCLSSLGAGDSRS